jgi:uncharacterized membrane protein
MWNSDADSGGEPGMTQQPVTQQPEELAKRMLRREWENLSGRERTVIEAVLRRLALSRNPNREFREAQTYGERLSDRMAALGGSWGFIIAFLFILAIWMVLNTGILGPRHEAFDPYPYILLNLFLSMLAAFQAPVILMSQNRQAKRDRLDAQHDYEVNLKAELEVRLLHDKVDLLRDQQWSELVRMQQDQLEKLQHLLTFLLSQRPSDVQPETN